ncbi:MAG: hypothetical protein HYR62_04360, partial [Actinobacteria bacterium]|nr:hypothetical protein [Actinomycetota bacterium]MBI3685870.1 hypothetical protein [Actinomycetota bacterium]
MHRAAAGLAVCCLRMLRERRGRVVGARVVMLVGAGDNGGDALLAGARLRARGVVVDALLVAAGCWEPGRAALVAVGGRVVAATSATGAVEARERVAAADLVLDAVVGLRGRPGLSDLVVDLLAWVSPRVPVVAVDLPSGVDPATGEIPEGHVVADVTVCFGALKPALLLPPATHAAGRVEVVDVGLGPCLSADPVVRRLSGAQVGALWPAPRRTDHKYSRSVLGVVAGSRTYPGAAVMACMGAVRSGAGIVKYVGPFRVRVREPGTGSNSQPPDGYVDQPSGGKSPCPNHSSRPHGSVPRAR